MSNLKRASMAMLVLALLGSVVSHIGVWYTSDDSAVVDEDFKLWRVDVTVENATSGATWFAEEMEDYDGIDQFKTAGPLVAAGGLFLLIAMLTVGTKMDHSHRVIAPGILGLLSAGLLIGGSFVYMQAIGAGDLDSNTHSYSGGLFVTFAAAGLTFIGSVLSFGYIRNPIKAPVVESIPWEEPEDEAYEHEVRKLTANEERLRCPACKHIFVQAKGMHHECPECGYEA